MLLADVDGTLMEPGTSLPDSTGGLIDVVTMLGGVVVPVSARSAGGLARLFSAYHEVSLAVGSGGGVIARIGRGALTGIVHEERLSLRRGQAVVDALLALRDSGTGTLLAFSGSDSSFEVIESSGRGALPPDSLRTIVGDRPLRRAGPEEGYEQLRAMRLLGMSLIALAEPGQLRDLMEHLSVPPEWRAAIYPEFRIPGWTWLEFFPAAANKGAGSRRATEALAPGARHGPELIALGDSADDIAMFAIADRSYCPITAAPQAQRAATAVLPEPGGPRFVAAVSELLAQAAR